MDEDGDGVAVAVVVVDRDVAGPAGVGAAGAVAEGDGVGLTGLPCDGAAFDGFRVTAGRFDGRVLECSHACPVEGADVDAGAAASFDGSYGAVGVDVVDEHDVADAVDGPVDGEVAGLECVAICVGDERCAEVLGAV